MSSAMDSGQERKWWEDGLSRGLRVQALCIGVSECAAAPEGLGELPNATADAKRIAMCVEELGESKSVLVGNLVDKSNLARKVRAFAFSVDKHRPPRIVLVFYAGHEMQHGDAIYLLPSKANPKTPDELKSQGLSHDELFCILKKSVDDQIDIRNVLYLVILGTCR